jgi:hypothetical protein
MSLVSSLARSVSLSVSLSLTLSLSLSFFRSLSLCIYIGLQERFAHKKARSLRTL